MDTTDRTSTGRKPENELHQFRESFATFNNIINNLQRQYLTLEKEYGNQESKLEKINSLLRRTIADNRAATSFLNSILNSLNSGVIAVDQTGTISHFNPAAERITGVSSTNALGGRYDEVMTTKRGGRFSALDTAMSGVEFESEEKTILNSAGEEIPLSISTALLPDDESGRFGAVEIFFDLTKIKKLEAEVTRVHTLAALGEMAATVAHEVRNPLGGIGGFAALLKRELAGDEEKMRLADKIITGVETLNQTVAALLDYTRRDELNLHKVTLARLIEESVEYERADQEGNGANGDVRLDVQVDDSNLEITCDPHLMRQVLLNLMRNSREAMSGGGQITIKAGRAQPADAEQIPQSAVYIEVADNGEGIPEDIRDKVFRPFFSTRNNANGTGLGLATAWKTVQAHGGVIRLSSETGRGSRFRIILPVNE